jgi:multiple sugar transport system substrate-binding protein
MKRFQQILFVLVATLLLALPMQAQEERIEIYITGLTEDTLNWFRQVAFPAFEAQHPGVKLDIITGGWGDFDATVAGWITTGDGPELVYLGSEYAATYGSLLADITPYLEGWEDLNQFLPAALETVSWDGALRGLPLLISPRPMFYRSDLAAEGSVVPALTFEDSLAFVKSNSGVENNALTKMGFMDIGSGLFDAQEFIAYIWSAGGELYYEDGSSAFDSPEVAEALQFMYDRRRAILPTETTAGLPPFEGTPIASGSVVSGIFPMWNMPSTADAIWNNIVIAPYPAGENGEPVVQVFIDWLSVPAYVEDPTMAVEFLKFITSKENATSLVTVAGYTPARQDAWEELRSTNEVWSRLIDVAVQYGRSFSDIRASAELRPLIVEQVTLFLTDQQSLEDTQAALKAEYDAILADNGYLN